MYDYKEKKKVKLAKLEKVGKNFILTSIRFDQNTGKKKDPAIFRLEKDDIKKKKTEFEGHVADLKTILEDMELLEKEQEK